MNWNENVPQWKHVDVWAANAKTKGLPDETEYFNSFGSWLKTAETNVGNLFHHKKKPGGEVITDNVSDISTVQPLDTSQVVTPDALPLPTPPAVPITDIPSTPSALTGGGVPADTSGMAWTGTNTPPAKADTSVNATDTTAVPVTKIKEPAAPVASHNIRNIVIGTGVAVVLLFVVKKVFFKKHGKAS